MLHLAIGAGAILWPRLFPEKKKNQEIYTIRLKEYKPVKSPSIGNEPKPKTGSSKEIQAKAVPVESEVNSRPEPKPVPVPVRPKVPEKPSPKPKPKPKPKKAVSLKKREETKPRPIPRPKPKEQAKKEKSRPDHKEPLARQREKNKPPPSPAPDRLLQERIKSMEDRLRAKKEEELLADRLAALKKELGNGAGQAENRRSNMDQQRVGSEYASTAKAAIMSHFAVPVMLDEDAIRAIATIIEIQVADDGRIITSTLKKGSGNRLFDRSAMMAIKETEKLPPLPEALKPGPVVIEVTFRPDKD